MTDGRVRSRTAQHEAGDYGERLFAALLPPEWVVHSYKGTEDYGIDFHVEVFANGRPTGLEFSAQVRSVGTFSTNPSVTLKQSSLVYMASKPYPVMVAVVSRSQRLAQFSWLADLISPRELAVEIESEDSPSKRRRFRLEPLHHLEDSDSRIRAYLEDQRRQLVEWSSETEHHRKLTDLYLDLHAALDCLIECVAIREKEAVHPDEVVHKTMFTLTLVIMSYQTLFALTADESRVPLRTPALTLLAIRKNLRELLIEIISEDDVAAVETRSDQGHVVSYELQPFWPALSRLLILFRESLVALAHFLAPWRNFNELHSGLARTVIEYNRLTPDDIDNGEPGRHDQAL